MRTSIETTNNDGVDTANQMAIQLTISTNG